MDDEVPDDPDIRRLWAIAAISREFGVLPSEVARDLATDPEQLSFVCLPLLRYAEAKDAFDHADKNTMKRWKGSKWMERVQANAFALVREAMERGE